MSIYEYIKGHCVDGVLPEDFSLPQQDTEPGKLRFAAGAMDGMLLYHSMGSSSLDEVERLKMEELVQLISEAFDNSSTKMQMADDALLSFSKKHRAFSVIDELQGYIRKKSDRWNAANLYHYGLRLVYTSEDIECVKFGMELLELFTLREERAKDAVRTMGLCDEFTLFSLFIMMHWENGNEEIFDLAKKVTGWGRVHAVEYLKAETEEIRDWFLLEGDRNRVLPEYSSLTCFQKSEAEMRLEHPLSDVEFRSIGRLLGNMLCEGPVTGINGVEDPQHVLGKYLKHAEKRVKCDALELADYEVILSIEKYAAAGENEITLIDACRSILESVECQNRVMAEIQKGRGIELAKELGVDYRKPLLECFKNLFDENYYKIANLLDDEAYVEPVLQIFMDQLPLNRMATGPKDEMGLGPKFQDYRKLLLVIQELKDKPGAGKELLKTALNAPVINNRNMAVAVLKSWTEIKGKTLKEFAPDLYAVLVDVIPREVREDVKARMEELVV